MARVQFENKDCFEFLREVPSGNVDLVLLDPPYLISRPTDYMNKGDEKFHYSTQFGDWDKKFDRMADVISECYRVLRKGGTIICFYDLWKITTLKDYMAKAGFNKFRFIEWIKTNPVPVNSKVNYLTNAREIAVTAVKGGKPTFHSQYDNGVYRFPIYHGKGRFHPTEKPVALMQQLVLKHSNENDTVLDCFAGSASVAVAAINTNRNFIGCEIDKEYFSKAKARLNELGFLKEQ